MKVFPEATRVKAPALPHTIDFHGIVTGRCKHRVMDTLTTIAEASTPSLDRPLQRASQEPRRLPNADPSLRLEACWATSEEEVRQAQRLRHRVFAQEMGAPLTPMPGQPADLDVDTFDEFCEHLMVRAWPADGGEPEIVGTYRVLTPRAARRAGRLYADGEFDLSRLQALRGRMVELGRACTHPDHRSGAVILMLWSSLAQFMVRNGLELMVGCASVPMADGGHAAAALWRQLRETSLADAALRVQPRLPLPVEELDRGLSVEPPALLKGYLRCGARVLGAPAWDPDFGTADLPIMLDLADVPEAYRRRFMLR